MAITFLPSRVDQTLAHDVFPFYSTLGKLELEQTTTAHQSQALTLEYLFVYIMCDVSAMAVYTCTILLSLLQFLCQYLTIITNCWQTNLGGGASVPLAPLLPTPILKVASFGS